MQLDNQKQSLKETDYESVWLNYSPVVAWYSLLLFVFYLFCYGLVVYLVMQQQLGYLTATPLCAMLAYAGFTVMHDAGHGSIFSSSSPLKPLEKVLGWICSVPLLVAPFSLFKVLHDRHHAFTNDPVRDPDHFHFKSSWFGVVFNSLIIPLQYHFVAFWQQRKVATIRTCYLTSLLYYCGILTGAMAAIYFGYGQQLLFLLVIPAVLALFVLVMFFDYVPHFPHKSLERFHNTRIYPSKLLNILLLGQNYHLIHHMYPRVPWYLYQSLYLQIKPYLKQQLAAIGSIKLTAKTAASTSFTHSLARVTGISPLTSDSVLIRFTLANNQRLIYSAGQYVIVSKWLNQSQQNRCYSLCFSPNLNELAIAVKAKQGGLVSNYLNKDLRVGEELLVSGPFGDFCYRLNSDISRIVVIACGSGITPILSIIETALVTNSLVKVELFYANKNTESIMFSKRIYQLQGSYADRLNVHYFFSQQQGNQANHQLMAKQTHFARLNSQQLMALLPQLNPKTNNTQINNWSFYICGPTPMQREFTEFLQSLNISQQRIHIENFITEEVAAEGKQYRVKITRKTGEEDNISVAANQTVLQVANKNQLALNHACGAGSCGSCKLKVAQGRAIMSNNSVPGITSRELSAGYILACQACPQSDLVLVES